MAYIDRGLNHSHHTTIHQQVLACYVGGIIRKEERMRTTVPSFALSLCVGAVFPIGADPQVRFLVPGLKKHHD